MSKYYITTSIPYVNADPHIGHALELIYADVLSRYARSQGKHVIFSTGTDEHGGKIAEKAKQIGISPQAYSDQISQKFKELTSLLNISNNRFIRTTDEGHVQRAQLIWQSLKKDIYKDIYIGWYCTGDEAYFSETEVKQNNGICPAHNRPYEKLEEDNYFFRLSKYEEIIAKKIESDEFLILPKGRKNEILSLIKGGLDDISISRPKKNLQWGISVPGDNDQVMYVWFEALMNYITVLGYPENTDFKNYWPADRQVIGKDIIRFHAAIWPAMLFALGLELPKSLYVHGFITVDGQKMSKSLGNVITPKSIITKFGLDAMRYYFLRHISSYEDGDFSWEKMKQAYNNELANELGNCVSRTVSMIVQYLDGRLGKINSVEHDRSNYDRAINNCRFDNALDEIWQHIKGLNQYIDEEKPWLLYKNKETDHLKEVLNYQAGSLIFLADLLAPFLPDTAETIVGYFQNEKLSLIKPLFPKNNEIENEIN